MLTNLIKCGCCNTFSSFSPKIQLFKSLRLYNYKLNCWETAYFILFFIFSFRNRVSFRYYGCGCWALRIWKIGNLRFPFWTAGTIQSGTPLPDHIEKSPMMPSIYWMSSYFFTTRIILHVQPSRFYLAISLSTFWKIPLRCSDMSHFSQITKTFVKLLYNMSCVIVFHDITISATR